MAFPKPTAYYANLITFVKEEKPVIKVVINREENCPFLLRAFCSNSQHNAITEYSTQALPMRELQIYTWMDASLQEIMSLVREVHRVERGTHFDFNIVFPAQTTPGYRYRNIGQTYYGRQGNDGNTTLADVHYTIGDFMDIAITPPVPVRNDSWLTRYTCSVNNRTGNVYRQYRDRMHNKSPGYINSRRNEFSK